VRRRAEPGSRECVPGSPGRRICAAATGGAVRGAAEVSAVRRPARPGWLAAAARNPKLVPSRRITPSPEGSDCSCRIRSDLHDHERWMRMTAFGSSRLPDRATVAVQRCAVPGMDLDVVVLRPRSSRSRPRQEHDRAPSLSSSVAEAPGCAPGAPARGELLGKGLPACGRAPWRGRGPARIAGRRTAEQVSTASTSNAGPRCAR